MTNSPPVAPVLFGTDGVRGIAGVLPLEKNFIRRLGAAAAAVYRAQVKGRQHVFLLGRDTRGSGPWIAQAFAEGAATLGVRVIEVGVISTPSLAFLVPKEKMLGGAMISASHNPADFNGIKLFSPQGRKCPDAWEREIEKAILDVPELPHTTLKVKKDPQILNDYLTFLRKTLPAKATLKGMRLVIDCSHGSLSKIAPAFLRKLGATIITVGTSPNGRNINSGCGSQETNVLRSMVLKHKAHGGLAFDGDADRIILCDELGNILDGDFIIAGLARFLKEDHHLPGDEVVITVMANLGLVKALESWGVRAETTPVGDRYVSDRLEILGAALGGEQSGHIIFHDLLPTGDGLLTGIQMLHHLRKRQLPMSWIHGLFKRYPQVLMNVKVKEKKPIDQCLEIQAEIDKANTLLKNEGRVFVRYSGTEPLLRIMLEGPDEPALRSMAEAIASQARRVLGAA